MSAIVEGKKKQIKINGNKITFSFSSKRELESGLFFLKTKVYQIYDYFQSGNSSAEGIPFFPFRIG